MSAFHLNLTIDGGEQHLYVYEVSWPDTDYDMFLFLEYETAKQVAELEHIGFTGQIRERIVT